MLEKQIEKYLIDQVQKLNCVAYKFVSPGVRGVPDRIILIPGGRTLFVELKAPGKELRVVQKHQHNKIKALGFTAYVIDSKAGVDDLLSLITACLNQPIERGRTFEL